MKSRRLAAFWGPAVAALLISAPALAADGKTIRYGQTVKGDLRASDTRAEDETLFDLYRFNGKAGERVVLELRSGAFDSFLALYGDGVDPIAFDDDGGGGKDARVAFVLPKTGAYRVRANAIGKDEAGGYTLRLARIPQFRTVAKAILVGGRHEGDLTRRSAQALDESYFDLYRFSGTKGDRISVELKSVDFDAFLSIHKSGEEKELGYDDDGGTDGDAKLVFVLPHDGDFDIRANTLGKGETGHYVISLDRAAAPTVQQIAYGQTLKGTLQRGDNEADDASLYHVYRFMGVEGDRVVITMRSSDVDAYVSLHMKDKVEEIASDDDGLRQGSDARLVVTLPASGMFDIWANTLKPGEMGDYELTIERRRTSGQIA